MKNAEGKLDFYLASMVTEVEANQQLIRPVVQSAHHQSAQARVQETRRQPQTLTARTPVQRKADEGSKGNETQVCQLSPPRTVYWSLDAA